MNHKYILVAKHPVKTDDVYVWAQFFEKESRLVAHTLIEGVKISTVFLGLDHRWKNEGLPILFETMIFGGKHDQYQERYCTWEEAEAGHLRAVERVRTKTLWELFCSLFKWKEIRPDVKTITPKSKCVYHVKKKKERV
jgi:hypothetical protein